MNSLYKKQVFATITLGVTILMLGATVRSQIEAKRPSVEVKSDVPLTIDPDRLVKSSAIVLGSATARFKLVEFMDYECPPCRAMQPTLKKLVEDSKGQLAVYARNYPLSFHLKARPAALLGLAIQDQGDFAAFHHKLMEETLDGEGKTLEKAVRAAGLDFERMQKEAKASARADTLAAEMALADSLGVQGTPTFFLIEPNGQVTRLGSLKKAVDLLD